MKRTTFYLVLKSTRQKTKKKETGYKATLGLPGILSCHIDSVLNKNREYSVLTLNVYFTF